MTPTEALDLLNKVCANLQGTRADHDLISRAITTLAQLVADNGDPGLKSVEA